MTQTTQGIDLAALASQYRVIPSSPAFEEVRSAIDRLRKAKQVGTRHDVWEVDVELLAEFRELVEANAEVMGEALALAFLIGSAQRGIERGEAIAAGLGMLSRAYGFAQVTSPTEVLSIVRRVAQESMDVLNRKDDEVLPTMLSHAGELAQATADEWRRHLVDSVESISNLQVHENAEWERIEERAWLSCAQRIGEDFLRPPRSGAPFDFAPRDVAELYYAARGKFALAKFDLAEMNYTDWFELVAGAARSSETAIPPAIGWLSLAALGFGRQLMPIVTKDVRDVGGVPANVIGPALSRIASLRGERPDAILWVFAGNVPRSGMRGMLPRAATRPGVEPVVRDAFGALRAIPTRADDPTLMPFLPDLQPDAVVRALLNDEQKVRYERLFAGRRWCLVIEARPDRGADVYQDGFKAGESCLRQARAKWDGEVVYVFSGEPRFKPAVPFIVAPKTLDDVLRAARVSRTMS